MKLLDILNEVENEELKSKKSVKTDSPLEEAETTAVDEIGKFFVTIKPSSKNDKIEDIVMESDVLDFASKGLEPKTLVGIYKQKSDARRVATEAIKEYESQLKEMEDAMEAFRGAKKDIEDKKASAKEKIQKLKQ
jgi:hypothetical protein